MAACILLPLLMRPMWFLRAASGFTAIGTAVYAFLASRPVFYAGTVIALVIFLLVSYADRPVVHVRHNYPHDRELPSGA